MELIITNLDKDQKTKPESILDEMVDAIKQIRVEGSDPMELYITPEDMIKINPSLFVDSTDRNDLRVTKIFGIPVLENSKYIKISIRCSWYNNWYNEIYWVELMVLIYGVDN